MQGRIRPSSERLLASMMTACLRVLIVSCSCWCVTPQDHELPCLLLRGQLGTCLTASLAKSLPPMILLSSACGCVESSVRPWQHAQTSDGLVAQDRPRCPGMNVREWNRGVQSAWWERPLPGPQKESRSDRREVDTAVLESYGYGLWPATT